MDFRFYLFDQDKHITAADNLIGMSIDDAIRIAEGLYEGCTDHYGGFELWSGKQRIASKFGSDLTFDSAAFLPEHLESSMIALEERLEDAFGCFSRSKRLLDRKQRRRLAEAEAHADVPRDGRVVPTEPPVWRLI